MLLKMEEIKLQLRLDDDFSDEDELLELLGKAAQSRTENFLNRKLYATADDEAGYFQGRHDCNAFFYRLGDGRELRKRFYNVAWFWKLNPLELRRTAISHFADLEAEAVRINEEMKHG
ncbi:head-tail connector protein [Escherichia coli]|nr:head-tail connector protein [Escherichia coli]